MEVLAVAVAAKPLVRCAKLLATWVKHKIVSPPSQRLRSLRPGDKHYQSRELQHRLALFIDATYTKSDATTDVASEQLQEWAGDMEGCPVTREEENEAGMRHFLRSSEDPDEELPELVICFRGTEATWEDFCADVAHALCRWQTGLRFKACKEIAGRIIDYYLQIRPGMAGRIVLTGHSLGAAYALLIWSQFVAEKPTFVGARAIVFNPPHLSMLSVLHKALPGRRCREWFRSASVTEGTIWVFNKVNQFTNIVGDSVQSALQYMWYARLANFPVVIYVNANDVVCKDLEAFYKQHHNKPHEMPKVHDSIMEWLDGDGDQVSHFKALVPSVNMYVNTMSEGDDLASHKLTQWIHPSCLSSSGGGADDGDDGAQLFDLRYEEYRLLGNTPPEWNEHGLLPKLAFWKANISQSHYEAAVQLV